MTKNGRAYLVATLKSAFSKKAAEEKRRIARKIDLDRTISIYAQMDANLPNSKGPSKVNFDTYKAKDGTYVFDLNFCEVRHDNNIDLDPIDGDTEKPSKFSLNAVSYKLEFKGFEQPNITCLSEPGEKPENVRVSISTIAKNFLQQLQTELGIYGDIYVTKKGSNTYYGPDDEVHEIGFGDGYQVVFVPEDVEWSQENIIQERYTKKERKAINDFYKARQKKQGDSVFIGQPTAPRRKAEAFRK